MWSPKSPVILPGKQRTTDASSTQYFFDLLYNEEDVDDGYYEDADVPNAMQTTSFIDSKPNKTSV
jgi:hypothetical protein